MKVLVILQKKKCICIQMEKMVPFYRKKKSDCSVLHQDLEDVTSEKLTAWA